MRAFNSHAQNLIFVALKSCAVRRALLRAALSMILFSQGLQGQPLGDRAIRRMGFRWAIHRQVAGARDSKAEAKLYCSTVAVPKSVLNVNVPTLRLVETKSKKHCLSSLPHSALEWGPGSRLRGPME